MKKKYTYKAIIRHEPGEDYCRLEWISGKPRTNVPLEVEITTWEDKSDLNQYKVNSDMSKAAAALRKIAEMGGTGIEDPVAWQREIRKDRPLPGRD